MFRKLFLAVCLLLGWQGLAWAQIGCIPNPNLAGPPNLVDGCPIPASVFNNFLTNLAAPLSVRDTQTGAVVAQGASITVNTNDTAFTAKQIADWIFCNCTLDVSYDAVRGIGILNSGSTIDLVNGVAGYVMSDAVISGPFPTAVALFGMGIADVNSSSVWGINTALSDNRGQFISSGTGRALFNEFDLNFTSTSSTGTALQIGGASLAQPTNVTGFNCAYLDSASHGTVAKWSRCFFMFDGAALHFAEIGAQTAPTGSTTANSGIVQFTSYLSNTAQFGQTYFGSDGEFHFDHQLYAPAATLHASTNNDMYLTGFVDLASGVAIASGNDANNSPNPLELLASKFLLNNIVSLGPSVGFTLATTLPACVSGLKGYTTWVTDAATSPVYNATATGGGSVIIPVFCNGTNWTNH